MTIFASNWSKYLNLRKLGKYQSDGNILTGKSSNINYTFWTHQLCCLVVNSDLCSCFSLQAMSENTTQMSIIKYFYQVCPLVRHVPISWPSLLNASSGRGEGVGRWVKWPPLVLKREVFKICYSRHHGIQGMWLKVLVACSCKFSSPYTKWFLR